MRGRPGAGAGPAHWGREDNGRHLQPSIPHSFVLARQGAGAAWEPPGPSQWCLGPFLIL